MRVLLTAYHLIPGGAEKVIVNLARGLRENHNTETFIFAAEGKETDGFYKDLPPEMKKTVFFPKTPPPKIPFIKTVFRTLSLIRAAREIEADLIYSHVMNLPSVIAGKVLGVPVIVVEMNNPEARINDSQSWKWQSYFVLKTAKRLASVVVAVSSELAEFSRKYWNLKEKPPAIHNGIDIKEVREKSGETASHPWIENKETPLVVSVGRIVAQKDFGTLIGAFDILRNKTDARLIIVGGRETESEKAKLMAMIRNLNLTGHISFAGEDTNPYPFMKAADVYVSSSIYEGFGITVVEAQTLGTPCVSTDYKFGANEIIEDGKSGILVPVGNAEKMAEGILKLIENPELAKQMGENAAKRAGDLFSIEVMTEKHYLLFKEVAEV